MSDIRVVTVITPTYNRGDYLVETIESVLSQDIAEVAPLTLEYIVLDDGSTDDSREILERYAGRIRSESHPNMGEVRTVNRGFEMAHGDIIGVVNSDDPLLPGAIAAIVQFMRDNPEKGVVYPDWNMIDAEGKLVQHVRTFDYSYVDMLRWHHCVPGPGTFFRRDVVTRLNGRDPRFRYVSDFDFWLRAGLITDFARVPSTLATFRMHPGSASSSQTNEDMADEHIVLVNKIFALPGLTEEALRVKRESYSSAHYIAGCVCQSSTLSRRARYFGKAVALSPGKYLLEYRKRTIEVIPIFVQRRRLAKGLIGLVMCLGGLLEAVLGRVGGCPKLAS